MTKLNRAALACLAPLTLLACQGLDFDARRTETFEVPADGIETVTCRTHNGKIAIRGTDDAAAISITATKRVSAVTQEEADTALDRIEIVHEVVGDTARIGFRLIDKDPSRWQATVGFEVVTPSGIAARARSHNGGISIKGMHGALAASTHNGGISVQSNGDQVEVDSHNGGISVAVTGEGPLDGSIKTHNGGVSLRVADTRSTRIRASTHNGGMRTRDVQVVESSRRSVTAEVGDAVGRMIVDTYNGGIGIRAIPGEAPVREEAPVRDHGPSDGR